MCDFSKYKLENFSDRISSYRKPENIGEMRLVDGVFHEGEDGFDDSMNYHVCMIGGLCQIVENVYKFIEEAKAHQELKFYVLGSDFQIGMGLKKIAPFFAEAVDVPNISLPEDWWKSIIDEKIVNKKGVVIFDGKRKSLIEVDYTFIAFNRRYGYAVTKEGYDRMCFAFHGTPNRNDDYYVMTVITEDELQIIIEKYSRLRGNVIDKAEGEFREKFVDNHTEIFEGYNPPDAFWFDCE